MKPLKLKIKLLSIFCLIFSCSFCYAQQGSVTINQDKNIPTLLNLKRQINSNENNSERYRIQIYSGNRTDAYKAKSEFEEAFTDWKSIDKYEEPNYKIWVGNFRTRLEADRALKKIKTEFPTAFIFKPRKSN